MQEIKKEGNKKNQEIRKGHLKVLTDQMKKKKNQDQLGHGWDLQSCFLQSVGSDVSMLKKNYKISEPFR